MPSSPIPRPDEDERERMLELLESEAGALRHEKSELSEALSTAIYMLRQEDAGWAGGNGLEAESLGLSGLKTWSSQIRAAYTGTPEKAPNPHIRNGFRLRHSYVWAGGIKYSGIPVTTQGKRGVNAYILNNGNQRRFFGSSARMRRELALFADGIFLAVGHESSKELRSIPLGEITATHHDDTYSEDILAYRWTRKEVVQGKTERQEHSYWVFVDWVPLKERPELIRFNGKDEKVLQDWTAFDLLPNRPEGFAFGSPDAIAAVVWARIIRDLIMNGVKMQDALAMIAFRVAAASKTGAENASAAIAGNTKAGSTVYMGKETLLTPLSSAGRGYDFDSFRFVVSTMAASLHVSGIALASDTAFAGSSYGAAQTLDLPTKLAMTSRRDEHIEFDQRVLDWLGAPDAQVYFDPYTEPASEYRAMQSAVLAWSTGAIDVDEFRGMLEDIFGYKFTTEVPNGLITPNNTKGLKQAPSPDQGQNNPAGSSK